MDDVYRMCSSHRKACDAFLPFPAAGRLSAWDLSQVRRAYRVRFGFTIAAVVHRR